MLSLVTACMNREAHLRRTLPEWLRLPGVDEIIVVDWSNATPLLGLAGLDPRVRVVRVEGEPRWVLSYAYNLGISQAAGDIILKCDADCLPQSAVTSLHPDATGFFAGHWRSGRQVGKPSVNGQCLFLRSQFERVNGYSEYIRTYGRDDEDFYDRLQRAGCARREIEPAGLDFLDHSEEERIGNQFRPAAPTDLEARITRHTVFNEMRNSFLAAQMPWGPDCPRAPYETRETGDRHVVMRRRHEAELSVPPDVLAAARLFGLRYLAGLVLNLPKPATEKLTAESCLRLIGPRLAG